MATFREIDFNEQVIYCENCGWSGKGSETHIIDFYGVVSTQQVECPNCKNLLGELKKDSERNGPPGFQIS